MLRAILIIGTAALAVGVVIYSLIDSARSDRRDVRGLSKPLWILVILLLPVIGALLWLGFGRPRYLREGETVTRGLGPDDDPEFLRSLDERRRRGTDPQAPQDDPDDDAPDSPSR